MLRTDATKLSYTPVNAETFAIWCAEYKERLQRERESTATGLEDKPTGKELFLQNRSAFDDIAFEEVEEEDTAAAATGQATTQEEAKGEDDEEEEEFVYDRALYDADGLGDEDVDFDDE